jgi:Glycosyl hydrolase 2 galactose-binding domain-like/Glycosyl hydrolases family 2/Glycosyl hydrolases family 2, TIM barrel domain
MKVCQMLDCIRKSIVFRQVLMFVFVVSAGWHGCLLAKGESPTNREKKLTVRVPGMFDSYETMREELAKLRQAYKPFMRSLPTALNVRKQTPIDKQWRFAYEVEPFELSKEEYVKGRDIPQPKKWYTKDYNDSSWEKVDVPEWRYQRQKIAGWHGKAPTSVRWYRTSFSTPVAKNNKRLFLVFNGVDWRAQVWLNGKYVGSHITYYEPFRFDVTELLEKDNVLAVRVIDGPGYGEPVAYWSPFPGAMSKNPRYTRDNQKEFLLSLTGPDGAAGPQGISGHGGGGGGLIREVYLESCGEICVAAVFARANLRNNTVRVKVETDARINRKASIEVQIIPENFTGQPFRKTIRKKLPEGFGEYEITVPISGVKLWSPRSPYLYRCRVILKDGDRIIDSRDVLFGCRSFTVISAEESKKTGDIQGTLYLNGKPIFLRGANTNGLNLWWYWGQDDKIVDCLLMLKLANFNMIRATQHVNFPEVRKYMDRLGIMSEQDQGYGNGRIGITSPEEWLATAKPLARECYNNPGVVMVNYGNEVTVDTLNVKKLMDEVLAVDPERIIMPVSGLRKTVLPTGYSNNLVRDYHSYEGWYGNPGKVWNLTRKARNRGPKDTPGVNCKFTMGEYGAEALDSHETMKSIFPPQFEVPDSPNVDVLKGYFQVKKADLKQKVGFYGKTPRNLGEYIEASQNYQALLLAERTTTFRISPEKLSGYIMFYFAEPLPSFWPKAIVSSNLCPKKAYYEMAKVNRPLVPLFQIQKGGRIIEMWVANDLAGEFRNCKISWIIKSHGKELLAGSKTVDVPASNAILAEKVDLTAVPEEAKIVKISLRLTDSSGRELSSYERELWLELWRKEHAVFK